MDWINDFTKKWKLKSSFLLYLSASLIFSIPFALICQLIVLELRKKYILSKTLHFSKDLFDQFMFSNFLIKCIDWMPIFIIILFLYLFFNFFYIHKIQSILSFLDQPNKVDMMDQNELSNKVYELIVERDRLEKEIFIYIRSNQEILKERDTLLHEIKNPLTILSGDIEMLSTHYLPEDPKIHRLLERMSRSQKRIQDYIKNLAIHENIKTLTIDCKKVPIEAFVKFVQKELHHFQNEIVFKNAIYNPTQEIEIDLEIFLEGLLNIIKNSDTHATSMIFITIYEKESNLIVEVEDDGPGFSQNALKNYKQPYFSENPLVSNMGLGLYITDKIMEKLNIEMILSNQLGANTKLIIKKL